MTPIIEKHIGEKSFNEEVDKFLGNQEYKDVFQSFLSDFLKELQTENDIQPGDTPDSLLEVPKDYINCYIKCREEGFSEVWSNKQAELKISMDDHNYVIRCYEEIAAINKEDALNDLRVFCDTKNGDKLYTDFLIYHVTNNEYTERPIEEMAADFSTIYKKQLEKGKSEIYSRKYAELIVGDEFHEIYCEDYAHKYDGSLNLGKSEEYAERYAEKYASELADVKLRTGISNDEESLDFARAKAKAYINGWEYANENNLEEKSHFIECYSNSYLNTFFSDNPNEWKSIEECEELAIEKALVKFERSRKPCGIHKD